MGNPPGAIGTSNRAPGGFFLFDPPPIHPVTARGSFLRGLSVVTCPRAQKLALENLECRLAFLSHSPHTARGWYNCR